MLTIDDINSIVEKYGDAGYWLSVPVSELPINEGDYIQVDILKITKLSANIKWRIYCDNAMFGGIACFTKNGNLSSYSSNIYPRSNHEYDITLSGDVDTIHFYLSLNSIINGIEAHNGLLIFPISELTVPIFNGNFDDRFYINPNGNTRITLDGVQVPLQTDEKGSYILLPSAERCVLGTNLLSLYTITFKEFKTLPILSIPIIYKGNTQTITLLNDTEEITEFQAYYKGELLTDNKITLPYDADDYIDITVDLLDNRYPNSTLKLKAPTMMYTANSQSDVETAISQGITTLQIGDTETEVQLNGITLTNVQLVNSHIQLNNCTLTDCQLIQSTYTDNGANNITDTNFNECEITTTQVSTYNDCTVSECTVTDSELHITGTLNNNTFNNSLIVSDGEITLTNNTFTGIGSKTYFPSHLYLTGDYTLQNNTFNLEDTFTELQFNMCLIKATNDFNVSEFINKNSFNLNITYGEEHTSTLYYNIVDDDKIRARRV